MNSNFLEIIQDNDALIEYKDFQIILDKKLRDKLDTFAQTIMEDEAERKELVRFGVRKALNLKDNDIIIIKKEQIFIKIFNEKKIKKVAQNEKNTIANRFNGIDEDEFDDFYDEYFSKDESRLFFQSVVQEFVERYFLEEKIDNYIYEKNVFGYIQTIIMNQLIVEFDYSEEFFKGFSGYVFRIHFGEVFEYIADFILNEIALSNEYMIEFLKYYSLNVVIVNGEKYRVPPLETNDGLKLNVISMLSIAKIYTRTRTSIKILSEDIYKLDEQIFDLFIDDMSPVDYSNLYIKERQKLQKRFSKENENLNKHLDLLKVTKNENVKFKLEQEIVQIKREMKLTKRELEALAKKEIQRSEVDKYLKLEREMDSMLRELKAEERILAQNEKSFLLIKESIAKALILKKQRI